MRDGPRAVAARLAHRLAPLAVLASLFVLMGDPRAGGAAGGLLAALAMAIHLIVFGVERTCAAVAPAILRAAPAWGAALAAGAGIFAATGAAFAFIVIPAGPAEISVGGALVHIGAFFALAGGGGLVLLLFAARGGADAS